MSPRAAWRLESLGFENVYDYSPGKLDWLAAGWPTVGTNRERPRAGELARTDVPTCAPEERLGDVRQCVERASWDRCVVVNEAGVVMGMLRAEELAADRAAIVGDVMRLGPSTFRPHVSAREMMSYMTDHEMDSAIITRSDGTLVGLLLRDDAARASRP